MTPLEQRNIELALKWQSAWNNDAMQMVDECYAPDCEVRDMFRGVTLKGREALRAVEKQIMASDPTRRMNITKIVAMNDTVVVEADAIFQNGAFTFQACAVLTFDDAGLIVSDHSYGAPPTDVADAISEVAP